MLFGVIQNPVHELALIETKENFQCLELEGPLFQTVASHNYKAEAGIERQNQTIIELRPGHFI